MLVAKVTPTLNKTVAEANWKVETLNPKDPYGNTENLNKEEVIQAVEKAGYMAQKLS